MFTAVSQRLVRFLKRTGWVIWGRYLYFRDMERGELDRALAAFERAVLVDPASFTAHLFRGIILERQGRRDSALAAFAIAYRLNRRAFRKARVADALKSEILWRESVSRDMAILWKNLDGLVPHGTLGERTRESVLPGPSGEERRMRRRAEPVAGIIAKSDFSSLEEMHRLMSLPPIEAEEVRAVDIDALIASLLDDA